MQSRTVAKSTCIVAALHSITPFQVSRRVRPGMKRCRSWYADYFFHLAAVCFVVHAVVILIVIFIS
jgi:hypothetical protein